MLSRPALGLRCHLQLWQRAGTLSGHAESPFCVDLASSRTALGHFSPAEHQGPCKECCVMQSHVPWPDASVEHYQSRCLGAMGQEGVYKQCNLQLFSGPKHLQWLMHPRHIQAGHQGKKRTGVA